MATLSAQDLSVDLRAVTVRPTWGAQEHRRWDRLVAEHHYLPFHGVIGKGLRHVAVHGMAIQGAFRKIRFLQFLDPGNSIEPTSPSPRLIL